MNELIDLLAINNRRRLRAVLGYLSARQYEDRWIAALCNKAELQGH